MKIICVLLLVLLSACANHGFKIANPTDAVAQSYGELAAAARATARSAKQEAITPAQAQQIKEKLQSALDATHLARAALGRGQPEDAAQALRAVSDLLLEIRRQTGDTMP